MKALDLDEVRAASLRAVLTSFITATAMTKSGRPPELEQVILSECAEAILNDAGPVGFLAAARLTLKLHAEHKGNWSTIRDELETELLRLMDRKALDALISKSLEASQRIIKSSYRVVH